MARRRSRVSSCTGAAPRPHRSRRCPPRTPAPGRSAGASCRRGWRRTETPAGRAAGMQQGICAGGVQRGTSVPAPQANRRLCEGRPAVPGAKGGAHSGASKQSSFPPHRDAVLVVLGHKLRHRGLHPQQVGHRLLLPARHAAVGAGQAIGRSHGQAGSGVRGASASELQLGGRGCGPGSGARHVGVRQRRHATGGQPAMRGLALHSRLALTRCALFWVHPRSMRWPFPS